MKSKKLLLIASSFLVIGCVTSCGNSGGELKAELKTERKFLSGETISKDDFRVTYLNGNEAKELESKNFTIDGFNNDGKYTFTSDDGKIGVRSKTFKVSANKVSTTLNVGVSDGRVTKQEFDTAMDNVLYASYNRNYVCDIKSIVKNPGQKEVTTNDKIVANGFKDKIELEGIDGAGGIHKEIHYEDYKADFKKYLVYNEDGSFSDVASESMINNKATLLQTLEILKFYFDDELFDKDKSAYVYKVVVPEPGPEGTIITTTAEYDVKFDANLNISNINENVVMEIPSETASINISRVFSNYGEVKEIDIPGCKTLHPLNYDKEKKCFISESATDLGDNKALFGLKLPKEYNFDGNQKLRILNNDGKPITYTENTYINCYIPNEDDAIKFEWNEEQKYYFIDTESPIKEPGEQSTLLFKVDLSYTGGTSLNNIKLEFTPSIAE